MVVGRCRPSDASDNENENADSENLTLLDIEIMSEKKNCALCILFNLLVVYTIVYKKCKYIILYILAVVVSLTACVRIWLCLSLRL